MRPLLAQLEVGSLEGVCSFLPVVTWLLGACCGSGPLETGNFAWEKGANREQDAGSEGFRWHWRARALVLMGAMGAGRA